MRRRPGPEGRPHYGPLGTGVFGSLEELDRVKFGQQVHLQQPVAQNPGNLVEGQRVPVLQVPTVGQGWPLGLVTVQLDRIGQQQTGLGASNVDVRAVVRYGIGGISDEIELDWVNGGLLTVLADEIRVTAVPYAPNGDAAFTTVAGVEYGFIAAGVGTLATGAIPPTWTTPFRIVPAGGNLATALPAFTRAVSLVAIEVDGGGNPLLTVDPYPDISLQLLYQTAEFAHFVGPTIAGGAAVPVSGAHRANAHVDAGAANSVRMRIVCHLGS